jgi:uroporphyrinogen III methyltransferase/synthase
MSGLVSLVGAGPGDPGLLTVKAARRIAEADVLIYDALASEPIVALAPATCELIYVGKRSRNHTMPQEQISALLVEHARQGRRVVRLKGGDPFVFGRGGEEAQELKNADIAFEIVPGISSALAAPAYAGIPVTHRSFNTNFTVATGHEDPTKGASTLDWERLADGHGTAVFLMAMGHLAGIVTQLVQHGRPATTPVAIISEGTTPRQRTVVATLETIVAEVERTGIGAPAIVVVGDVVSVREDVRWFDRHPLFGQRVLVTRPEPEARELGARLWEYGAEPLYAATMRRTGAPNPTALKEALDHLVNEGSAAFDWLICTSRHGVARLIEELHARGKDLRALGGISVAAIGPGTAQALKQAGITADLVPEDHRSEGLIQSLEWVSGEKRSFLIWTADGGRQIIQRSLKERGHRVTVALAYGTAAVAPDGLEEAANKASMWTFTSGSAIHGFVAGISNVIELAKGKMIVCLGQPTAQVAKDVGLTVTAVAESATLDGLCDALENAIKGAPALR